MNILEQILKLSLNEEEKFWIIFDWCKRDLFNFLKERITTINWKKNWVQELERIQEDLMGQWKEIQKGLAHYKYLKRLKGVIYEVLFYLNAIYTVSIFKGSWIMEIAGDSLIHGQKPPWLEIIPLYDILPILFRIKKNNKWELRAPQIEADFIINYWEKENNSRKEKILPLAFIDVKSTLKNYNPKKMVWYALGCKWFQNSILQISTPKKEFPAHLEDWDEKQVCWNCGKLHNMKKSIYCEHCGTKIWLASKEKWEPYPFK